MAGLREIRSRIKSVKNTKKTTYAMKLVSATKLRKAQEAVELSREYTNALSGLVARIVAEQSDADFSHPLLEERSLKRVALVVVGGSRGLCGAFNTNVNRVTDAFFKEHSDKEIDTYILGRKPAEHFRKIGRKYLESHEALGDDPNDWPLEEVMAKAEDSFIAGDVDAVFVIFTKFFSALTQSVEAVQLLPVSAESLISEQDKPVTTTGALFEPSPSEVFLAIVPRIVSGKLRQACLDSKASEHGSRMTAMDSATKNASDLIDNLTRTFNRLRQSGITSEILDIIGGAEGQK